MSSFMETELSTRWGFEDLVLFGSKVSGNPKKLQLEDWGFGDNNEMSVGSFNPSGIGFGRGGSGSEFGNGSSGKSWSGGSEKSPSSVISTPSTTGTKKMKSASLGGSTTPRCQVEGCNLDLSSAKDYHRKHRVCDNHSKSSKVIVKGLERRFCQQCSRFHGLSEFDEKKRSCRKRLSDHNARRRKPQQEMIEFNSSRLPSSFYDGRKQMTFLLNTGSQTRNAASTDWERTYESKFTITKGNTSKPDNFGLVAGQPHMTGNQVSYAISMHGNPSNGLLAPKGTDASRVLPHAFKDVTSATVGAAPDFHRALSLLSTNSWGSSEPVSLPFHNTMHASRINMPQMLMQTIPQSSLPSSEYWLDEQPSTYPRMHSLNSGNSRIGHSEGLDFYLSPHLH